MSSADPDGGKRVLYLQQIDIQMETQTKIRVRLLINNDGADIRRNEGSFTWIPSPSVEIDSTSQVTVVIKATSAFRIASLGSGKMEEKVDVGGQEITQAFWDSNNSQFSITKGTTFDSHPTKITLKFRPSPDAETSHAALQRLKVAIKDLKPSGQSVQQHIDRVLKYGTAFSEMNPIAKAALAATSATFDLLKEQEKYDRIILDLADGVTRILPFVNQVQEEALYENIDLVDGIVKRMYILVTEVAEFICSYTSRGPMKRSAISIVSRDDRDRTEDLTTQLSKLVEDFDRAIKVQTLKEMTRAASFRDLRLLKSQLKPADAGYDPDRCCLDQTRKSILDKIITWALQPSEKNIANDTAKLFWLYGMPGVGKTFVANSICDRLHQKRRLGGSFFCRKDHPILREPKYTLSTLVYDLAKNWRPYRKLVIEELRNDKMLGPDRAGQALLSQLLERLREVSLDPLVVVIDALDECGDPRARVLILEILLEMCSQLPSLKVVVTSRPEREIEAFFVNINATDIYLSQDLGKDEQAQEDIQLFARYRFDSVAEECDLPKDWPGKDILDQVVKRARGLFIYVDTIWRYIKDEGDPEKPLLDVINNSSGDHLDGLYELYSSVIESRVGRDKESFRRAIGFVIVASSYRPLCDETIAAFAGLQTRVVRTWVDRLNSLVYQDRGGERGIRVRHISIIDFITSSDCPREFRVSREQANLELGMACLTTMINELKLNICKIETSFVSNDDIKDLPHRIQENMSDALQYSCVHWASHISAAAFPASPLVAQRITRLFEGGRPLYWIEALSLMGKVTAGVRALKQILQWTKASRGQYLQHVNDTLQFLLNFSIPIMKSASHIYISALPFMPTESVLWKSTSAAFQNLIKVGRGRMESWPSPQEKWLGHQEAIPCLSFSPDGQNVVSGSEDKTIRMWDVTTGRTVGEPWTGHTDYVTSILYSPDGRYVVSGSLDSMIRMWDAETGQAIGEPWKGHTDGVRGLAYSPDGRYVFSVSQDKTIRKWDAETGMAIGQPWIRHETWIMCVTCSPNGRYVVSGARDQLIIKWNAETGTVVGEPWRKSEDVIRDLAYSPDGKYVVSCGLLAVQLWYAETGIAVGEPWRGHKNFTKRAAFSPDGRYVASCSDDRTVILWDVEKGSMVGQPWRGHVGCVYQVAYSPNGQYIVSASDDKTIRMWNAVTGEKVGEKRQNTQFWSVIYSPDGRYILSGDLDGPIYKWDAETGREIGEPWMGHTHIVRCFAYSPDGRYLATSSADHTVRVWDSDTGMKALEPLTGHTHIVGGVAWSPNGRYIISCSMDRTIRLWDAETGILIGEPWVGHDKTVQSLVYTPDSLQVISASWDRTIKVWDAKNGEIVGEPLTGHTEKIWSVVYSPNSPHIVSGSGDGTLRMWDIKTRTAVGEPWVGHERPVINVAYSPDGRSVASCSLDKTVRIWNTKTGEMVSGPLIGHADRVVWVAYSPGGHQVASAALDGTVRVWDAQSKEQEERLILLHSEFNSQMNSLSSLSIDLVPDSNGWIHHPTDGLLFWVPEYYRRCLNCVAVLTISTTGHDKTVRLDFTNFKYGKSWTEIEKHD